MDIQSEKEEKIDKIARDILLLSRNTLLVNLRFLDVALSQFELCSINKSTLLTDGKHILYNPHHVLKIYQTAREIPARDYLHIVMHCVFRHMYIDSTLNHTYWDLACDIAVENMIAELKLKTIFADRELQQGKYIEDIKKELKYITAEKIYSYLRKTMPNPEKIAEIRQYFYADNHEIWYMNSEESLKEFGTLNSENEENSSDNNENQNKIETDFTASVRPEMSAVWQEISKRMQVDLETFGKQRNH